MTVFRRKVGEQSFTLLETIIAIGIMTTVILELVKSQGNIVYFANYTRRLNESVWLAKRVMSQVEYQWSKKEFKEMETEVADQEFKDEKEQNPEFDYTYNLSVKEWKFPIMDLLTGKVSATSEEDGESPPAENPMGGMIEEMMEKVLGKDILKIANVEVFWPEGAKRNSVSLTMLLTNQRKVDEELTKLAPQWDKFLKEQAKAGKDDKKDKNKDGQSTGTGDDTDRPSGPNPPGG
jgi:type II secretory pathway pseudopilin PulG